MVHSIIMENKYNVIGCESDVAPSKSECCVRSTESSEDEGVEELDSTLTNRLNMYEDGDTLTPSQQRVYDMIINSDRNEFITGEAGTGKSLLCGKIVNRLRRRGFVVDKTAPTGIAAINIEGTTLNSWAGIGFGQGPHDHIIRKVRKSRARTNWERCDVLFIDEISMVSADRLTLLDAIGRRIRHDHRPFGGIRIIMCGDFYQLPPVPPDGKKHENFAFESKIWEDMKVRSHKLLEQMRQNDPVFYLALNQIRTGVISDEVNEMMCAHVGTADPEKSIKIRATNSEVNDINGDKLDKLITPSKFYKADINADNDDLYTRIKKDSNMLPELQLKTGARVILLRNLNIEGKLVNGSQGTITSIEEKSGLPRVKFDNKDYDIVIEHHIHSLTETFTHRNADGEIEYEEKVVASMKQIPLNLGWACTIHKAQGQSFNHADVDISRVFTDGQTYVALSRCRTLEKMNLTRWHKNRVKTSSKVVKFYESLAEEKE
jgi:ATP-dependent DNA helicase PIF1